MRVSDRTLADLPMKALRFVPAVLFLIALWLLGRELAMISGAHLWSGLTAIGDMQWGLALAATACGYAVLTLYDVLGLRLVGAHLPYRAAALGSFLSFSISHNVGLGWLSSGAMRERVYGRLGMRLADVARLTILNSLTFFVGAVALLAAVLVGEPAALTPLLRLPQESVRLLGMGFGFAILLYLATCAFRRGEIGWGRAKLPIPSLPAAAAQILLSSVDIMLAAAALYLLLPPDSAIGYPLLLGVYLVALGASVASQVPGGLGVLEGFILLALPQAPRAPLLAAMIGYRLVYYLIPLALALALLAGRHVRALRLPRLAAVRPLLRLLPAVAAALTLAAGAALLFAGADPLAAERLPALRGILPLPLLELSHLAGSVVGLFLVVLSTALYRRYDTACATSILLLVAGSAATLLSGGGVRQAVALAMLALLLLASRSAFYRRGSIARNALSRPGLVLGAIAVVGSVAFGLHRFSDVAYSHELWWQFAYDGNAPRFLRASLLVSVLAGTLFAGRLLGPARERRRAERPDALIGEVVAASDEAGANLAFVGDKRFIRGASGRGFLMYQQCGRSWISMGDPVGPRVERPELVWRFRERVDAAGGRPVFYEVLGDCLDLYADAGLVAHKIGEEARIDLAAFSLESPKAKPFRAALRRADRDDLAFGIIPAGRTHLFIDELRQVSEDWLAAKHAREKGFSLGFFDPDYLARFDCAVVVRNGSIIAFANVWSSAGGTETSLDLMRYRKDAPHETMLFLMLKLILSAKDRGYGWFNLGMAPLAGLAEHRLAPAWHSVGRLIFHHGEALYGFAGLRRFKEQFSPVWRPRYIVCRPGFLSLATALVDCSRLIAHPVRSGRPAQRPAAGDAARGAPWFGMPGFAAAAAGPAGGRS